MNVKLVGSTSDNGATSNTTVYLFTLTLNSISVNIVVKNLHGNILLYCIVEFIPVKRITFVNIATKVSEHLPTSKIMLEFTQVI